MLLSDEEIIALRPVEPFNLDQVQPASYDVTMGKAILIPSRGAFVTLGDKSIGEKYTEIYTPYVLKSNGFVLCHTKEYVKLPANIAGKFEGKSSLGRLGLMTHITAGFVDPGFKGQLTLEIKNVGPHDIQLVEGAKIGQIAFYELNRPAMRPYGSAGLGSHYQNSEGVVSFMGRWRHSRS